MHPPVPATASPLSQLSTLIFSPFSLPTPSGSTSPNLAINPLHFSRLWLVRIFTLRNRSASVNQLKNSPNDLPWAATPRPTRQRVAVRAWYSSSIDYDRPTHSTDSSLRLQLLSPAFSDRRIYTRHHVEGRAQCQERYQGVFDRAGKGSKWYV